ncbi:probable carotenoid cleavage dioxygenase 4, chloroplastic [Rhododendron vialii]|uniref:probable carotenoid cleavage dioxygenase 4, chloroplastic n=1 Tax=Rhododendron vialii TaxID=182163 RepID=UPI00265E8C8C|nr:probable carotenoid cleavage dioxygenase 4, chloroplastic [Rhododendron vialii]
MYSVSSSPAKTLWPQDVETKNPPPIIRPQNFHKPALKVVAQRPQSRKLIPPSSFLHTNNGSGETFKSLASSLFPISPLSNMLLPFLTTLASYLTKSPPLHPSVDPNFVLTGNFAPVDETPPTECLVVEGELPCSLHGVYIRNGPNPQHQPLGPHHLFEGDGMLHSILLSQGRAIFCSRYVKTYKYNLEHDTGFPMIPNFLSGFYGLGDVGRGIVALGRAMTGQISITKGFGLANTSLNFFCNTLFAMVETDLPYAIRITEEGDIETIGRHDFDGKAPVNMTAHPKMDEETGEVFAFRCFPVVPYLTYFRFDSNGCKEKDIPIFSINSPTYVHDFGITEHYAIFPDIVLEMAPMDMITLQGMPVRCRPDKVPRIGIIDRYATSDSEMRWFEVPGFNALHIIKAWEDDQSGIIIVATNALNIENFFHNLGKVHFSLEKLRIDMKTGKITRGVLSKRSLELGSINPSYAGKKSRYVYMAVCEQVPKMSGVVKIDLELGCEVAFRSYGGGCFGGEVLFVGRDAECDEDDGFVVSYVHNERENESRFVVMDAKSSTLDIVAAAKLPGRVPYGFHGIFLREKELQIM